MNSIFGDVGFLTIKKGIEVGALKHRIIAQNIANLSTPGYGAGEVVFEELLGLEFKLQGTYTHPAHLPIGRSELEKVEPIISRTDSIDIDREMVRLAKNSINWNANIQLLGFKYRMLLSAIRGR